MILGYDQTSTIRPFTLPEFLIFSVICVGAGVVVARNNFGFVHVLVVAIVGGGLLGLVFRAVRQRRANKEKL